MFLQATLHEPLSAELRFNASRGGPGSFVITADGDARFAEAVRRKLLLEIAGFGADPGKKHFMGYAKPGRG